jgi:cytochrome P450
MKNGSARDCFATRFLREPETKKYGQTQTYFALGSLMEAGSDTSRMTISQMMAAAILDKRWVITAREELDRICGKNAERLPTFDDRPQMRYLSAVTKEAFRWRPFAEIGVPHMLTQDDEYEGYKFPAGTLFTWNSMAIAQDPKEYEEPERFWPERFLNDDLDHVLKGHWSFGPGRRVCSGYNVGDTNVWIAVARLLYCFDFEGVPVSNHKLSAYFTDTSQDKSFDSFRVDWGEYRHAPFEVQIKVRSPAHAALIEREGRIAVDTKY